ncbi:hypothetical protein ACQZV8_13455 [Magnetococcales bacterium HHB-1]
MTDTLANKSDLLQRLNLLIAFVTLFVLIPISLDAAPLRIDITKGGLQPVPIAIPGFIEVDSGNSMKGETLLAKQITEVVRSDLESSGLFRSLDPKAFLQSTTSIWKDRPDFRNWRLVGAEAIVAGKVTRNRQDIVASFYLYDVFQGTTIGPGKRFSSSPRNWRHVAHRIADEIYTRLTGEKGYFTSRIAFVAQKGRKKWLAVMDQDGANRIDLTRGRNLVLTPRFSPGGFCLGISIFLGIVSSFGFKATGLLTAFETGFGKLASSTIMTGSGVLKLLPSGIITRAMITTTWISIDIRKELRLNMEFLIRSGLRFGDQTDLFDSSHL